MGFGVAFKVPCAPTQFDFEFPTDGDGVGFDLQGTLCAYAIRNSTYERGLWRIEVLPN